MSDIAVMEPPAGAAPVSADTLTGRDRESQDIDRSLNDPEGPRIVFVLGERGSGRSAFLRATARRQRAAGHVVLSVDCEPGDGRRPYLLALRLAMALEQRRVAPGGQRRGGDPLAGMLAAVEHGDRAAAADALTGALEHAGPTVVLVDDVQYADPSSVELLGVLDMARAAPGVRLVLSLLRPGGAVSRGAVPGGADAAGLPARHPAAQVIELGRLAAADVAVMLAGRLPTAPDDALTGLVHRMSRGVPAAVDALLAEWARQGDMRRAGEKALLDIAALLPARPEDNRFTEALRVLGEPAATVASALSVLWPLGRAALRLTAGVTGLSPAEVRAGLDELIGAGIVEELPEREGDAARGWTFTVPFTEHVLRERLGPMERGRLAAAAVEELWAAGGEPGDGTAGPAWAARVVAEADAATYLPDRIVEAGRMIDAGRAVAELVAAVRRTSRAAGRSRALRWLEAAGQMAGDTATRDRLLLSRALHAAFVADHRSVRGAVEELLQAAAGRGGPDEETVQICLSALVGATSAAGDLQEVSRMTEARWWWPLRLPPAAVRLGRALALGSLGRWRAAERVHARSQGQWGTGAAGVLPEVCRGTAELVLGRPERFRRFLAAPEIGLMSEPGRYTVTLAQVQHLLSLGDLRGAEDLLAARGLTVEDMPVHARFQWRRLEGRWDEAMAHLRWLRANGYPVASSLHLHLYPERATVILLARGRIGAARRLIADIRDGLGGTAEPRHLLDRAEAEMARMLGDVAEAVRVLRRGLETAWAHGEVFAVDELLAELAVLLADGGDLRGATACLRRLEEIAARTESGRSRLLWLVTSARLHAVSDADAAGKYLTDAVALARDRGQPFETATTLLAAARLGESPAALLTEAYELFGQVGAPLWRFRTRADMRRARVPVPDHDRATSEGDRLLATLVSEGLTNRRIAAVLGLSPDAVANRLTRLFARTGARSRTELVAAVLRKGAATADW